MSDEFIVQDEDRFAWMDDAIDKESVAVAGFELPKRTLAQATAILNYDSTLKAYKTSGAPAYSSGRKGAKRRRLDASEEDSFASVVSPVFERQRRDALGTSGEQVAHIIPHDTGCAVFYEAPAIGALGAPSPMTRCQKQSLIHGSRPASVLSRAKEDTRRQIRRRIL